MKILFYAAKIYDKKSFDPLLERFPRIEIDYIDHELEPMTAALAEGYDAICAFVSADVGAKTLEILNEKGVKTVLMRCAGYNNVDVEKAKEPGISVKIVPGYSPERDYAPRKDAPVEQLAPYSRSSRNGATAPSSSRNAPRALQNNATSPESPANTSPLNAPSKATDPSVEDFNLNDDVILLNNDLTSKDRPKDERATRVAMRTPSNEGGTTRAANSEKREKTSQKNESARSTGSESKSAYESERKKDSDDLSDVRSTRRGSAERYDAIESASIRGQDVLQRPNAKPLSNMTENSGFRLFHWFKPELAD